jgi:hypothetical protein
LLAPDGRVANALTDLQDGNEDEAMEALRAVAGLE